MAGEAGSDGTGVYRSGTSCIDRLVGQTHWQLCCPRPQTRWGQHHDMAFEISLLADGRESSDVTSDVSKANGTTHRICAGSR